MVNYVNHYLDLNIKTFDIPEHQKNKIKIFD